MSSSGVHTPTPLPTASPESVGLSSERLQRIAPIMQRSVDAGRVAGITTAVMRHGKLAHLESVGLRDLESRQPMTPDTICRVVSMVKPITSMATMILYEEGEFVLSDPVSDYLPQFKDLQVYVSGPADDPLLEAPKRELTIQDLLRNTAGLLHSDNGSVCGAVYTSAEVASPGISRDEHLTRWASVPLMYHPGERFNYSPSYTLLPHLIEAVSGTSFESFTGDRIFAPLGMMDSGFRVPSEKLDRFATLYDWTSDQGLKAAVETESVDWPGMVSTVPDYLRFCQMLLNGGELGAERFLMPATVRLMLTDHLPSELHPGHPGMGYGFGFGIVRDLAAMGRVGNVGEANWAGANSTFFWIDPTTDLIYMLFTQVQPMNFEFMRRMPPLAHFACLD